MGSRVPVQHYNLRSANSFIGSSLHDLNTVDARPGDIQGITADVVDRDAAVTDDSLDNDDDDSGAVDCMHESYRDSLPLHTVGVEEDRSGLENNGSSRGPYDILTINDISPIEAARARFMQIIVDHFIDDHVIEVADSEADYNGQSGQDKLNKRKSREVQYEGPCTFKRRELATSIETRTRFPELVIQEEKRVRFVVVNGLVIVDKPNSVPIDDAEWFKRLTGRDEVAVSARDYKFYSPRHKYRRVASNPVSNIPGLPTFPGTDTSPTMASAQGFRTVNEPQNQQATPSKHHMQSLSQFHPIHQNHHQPIHQTQHSAHFSHSHQCGPPSHLPEIPHGHQSPTIPQHMACLQPITGGHVSGRLHVLPTSPAKFCDECGAPYLRETSKFCSECGGKRFGT
ncbi:uncharacterized protein At2g02148 isoform X4 [Vitis vinifera]|uniref:uncharacterized protein At2g02148 isoform X4 n=1 Tax=Vitis vinifera TaxID=29760 RepID=UPI0005400355|nr:uncharacterized protein At2g02148 isoform X4 [Vitis vinifera]|eukprot:XP_010654778.1 PREDICTED: uncharacterized protein At2g02148 isoform X4 [Vitis vinifera]